MRTVTLLTLLACLALPACQTSHANTHPDERTAISNDDPELAQKMRRLQYYQRKLGYTINGQHHKLAKFYAHETEETLEDIIAEVPRYDGFPISQLAKAMAMPPFERLVAALDGSDWHTIAARYQAFVKACNDCHVTTEHGFIKVHAAPSALPFDQDFSVP